MIEFMAQMIGLAMLATLAGMVIALCIALTYAAVKGLIE